MAYRGDVTSAGSPDASGPSPAPAPSAGTDAPTPRPTWVAVLVYTLLRVALFAVVFVVIDLLTPIHGIWAAAAAILMSGAISLVVLDRQRGPVGQAAARFFGRINARIDASARAEDVEDVAPSSAPDSGQAEQQS